MKNRSILLTVFFLFMLSCVTFTGCQGTAGKGGQQGSGTVSQPTFASGVAVPVRYIPEFQLLPYSSDVHQVVFDGDTIYMVGYTNRYNPSTIQSDVYRGLWNRKM